MTAPPGFSSLITTPPGQVEYQLQGGSGPLLVGLHGSPGSCFQMSTFMDRLELTGRCCRRLTMSRPGYGRTPLASGPAIAEQSALLAALLDALNLTEPAVVFGFSGGGISTLDFASRYPERVEKLVLLSPVTGPYSMFGHTPAERVVDRLIYSAPLMHLTAALANNCPRLALRGLLLNISRLRGQFLSDELERLDDCPYDREFLLNILRHTVPFKRLKTGAWNDNRNVLAVDNSAFKTIRQPILMLHGDQDADVDLEQSESLHRLLPESTTLIRVPGGSHILLLEPYLDLLRDRVAGFCGITRA